MVCAGGWAGVVGCEITPGVEAVLIVGGEGSMDLVEVDVSRVVSGCIVSR